MAGSSSGKAPLVWGADDEEDAGGLPQPLQTALDAAELVREHMHAFPKKGGIQESFNGGITQDKLETL
jgi:hypothetical protein